MTKKFGKSIKKVLKINNKIKNINLRKDMNIRSNVIYQNKGAGHYEVNPYIASLIR